MLLSSGTKQSALYVLDEIYIVNEPLLFFMQSDDKKVFYKADAIEEYYPRRYADESFDRIIIKNLIGGQIIMARKAVNPSVLQPLQMDTAIVVPKSVLPGLIGDVKNVTGSTLAGLVDLSRISYGMPMPTGTYRIEVVEDGKYKVTNVETGFSSAEVAPAADGNTTLIPGVAVKIPALTGCVAGDYAEVDVFGDTTYIVPGTVLGRLKTGPNAGKYEVAVDPNIGNYDIVRIASGALETDSSKKGIGSDGSSMMVNADTLTVSVYVFAQLKEDVCKNVNMTDALKDKIQGIVWC